jgi:hypothetical protein
MWEFKLSAAAVCVCNKLHKSTRIELVWTLTSNAGRGNGKKKVCKWKLMLKRPLRRPKNRWEDDMKKLKIKNWTSCIQDHTKWKLYVEKAKTFKDGSCSALRRRRRRSCFMCVCVERPLSWHYVFFYSLFSCKSKDHSTAKLQHNSLRLVKWCQKCTSLPFVSDKGRWSAGLDCKFSC